MLGWMTGQNDQFAHSAGNSKVLEPETPAPVFALRAFKSALFGTPGAEEEETRERVSHANEPSVSQPRRQVNSGRDHLTEGAINDTAPKKAHTGQTGQPANTMASPTKSILLTPGTTSNRRKTVSFGDGVVDNERKQESPSKASSTTPTTLPPNTGSQLASGSSDGKPRSKLTQTLFDSRDKRSKDSEPTQRLKLDKTRSGDTIPKATAPSAKNDDEDVTLNMDEPRSQSGKYWKSELNNYKTKTDEEIERLMKYRSVAKSFCQKKDEEAARLAEKLRQEERKVTEMESRVSQLASTMVAEGGKADKEKLVKELTHQTALALQYKHRVTLLRKALEQHGVVSDAIDGLKEQPDGNNGSFHELDNTSEKLRRTQQALDEANAKIERMNGQRSDLGQLEDLAHSSEQKALDLEKENAIMKKSLARVKSEMTKYEGRRKEKEAKLKQREAKLEIRIHEYRERLKAVLQRHRNSQDSLKESFNDERQYLQGQIERLKLTIATLERLPADVGTHSRRTLSPRKGRTGLQVYDLGQSSPQKSDYGETEDIDEPPSPSPRARERRHRQLRNATGDPLDLKRAAQAMGIEINGRGDGDDDPLIYVGESPCKTQGRHFVHTTQDDDPIPPSSPPALESIEPSYYRKLASTRQAYDRDKDSHRLASLSTSRGRHLADFDEGQQVRTQRRRSPTKYGLDALSGVSAGQTLKQRHGLSELRPEALTPERHMAAKARLERKRSNRKGRQDGKENVKAFNY